MSLRSITGKSHCGDVQAVRCLVFSKGHRVGRRDDDDDGGGGVCCIH